MSADLEEVYIAYFDLLAVSQSILQGGLDSQAERLFNLYADACYESLEIGEGSAVFAVSDTICIEARTAFVSVGEFINQAIQVFERLRVVDREHAGLRGFVARGERVEAPVWQDNVYSSPGRLHIMPTSTALMKAYAADKKGSREGFGHNTLYVEKSLLLDAGMGVPGPIVPLVLGPPATYDTEFVCLVDAELDDHYSGAIVEEED